MLLYMTVLSLCASRFKNNISDYKMPFDIVNKVALVTGGAQGIGFECAKQLLGNKAKGIVIADIDAVLGKKSTKELNELFGHGKVVFIQTDTSIYEEYERAFKLTVDCFDQVDILVNNAGIGNERNWEECVKVNVNGFINGMILAMETYLRNFKSSKEAVIINTSSLVVFRAHTFLPVYTSTKYAVVGMTRTWGHVDHYKRTGVRVVAICPGPTRTNIINTVDEKFYNEEQLKLAENFDRDDLQSPEHLCREMVEIIKDGKGGSVWIVEEYLPRYEYVMPDKDTLKPK